MSQPAPPPCAHGRHRAAGPARVLTGPAAPVGRVARWLVVLGATLAVTGGAAQPGPSGTAPPVLSSSTPVTQEVLATVASGLADRAAPPPSVDRVPTIAPGPVLVLPHHVLAPELAEREAGLAALDQALTTVEAILASQQVSLDGSPLEAGPWPNGDLPETALCAPTVAPDALLRCDAAAALDRLSAAYRLEHGVDLKVVSSYRDLATQVEVKQVRGWLAAAPGTSQHGLGLAVDLGGAGALGQYDSALYRWLTQNAGAYGWYHPRAMQPGGGGPPEPWHWEFSGR